MLYHCPTGFGCIYLWLFHVRIPEFIMRHRPSTRVTLFSPSPFKTEVTIEPCRHPKSISARNETERDPLVYTLSLPLSFFKNCPIPLAESRWARLSARPTVRPKVMPASILMQAAKSWLSCRLVFVPTVQRWMSGQQDTPPPPKQPFIQKTRLDSKLKYILFN